MKTNNNINEDITLRQNLLKYQDLQSSIDEYLKYDKDMQLDKIVCKVLDVREYIVDSNPAISVVCEKVGEVRDRLIIRGDSTSSPDKYRILELVVPSDILILQVRKDSNDANYLSIVTIDMY